MFCSWFASDAANSSGECEIRKLAFLSILPASSGSVSPSMMFCELSRCFLSKEFSSLNSAICATQFNATVTSIQRCTNYHRAYTMTVTTMMATDHDGHRPWWPQTMMATRYTRPATAMKTWKTNSVLLRNCQIHDIVGQISPSYVFGRHCRTPFQITQHDFNQSQSFILVSGMTILTNMILVSCILQSLHSTICTNKSLTRSIVSS